MVAINRLSQRKGETAKIMRLVDGGGLYLNVTASALVLGFLSSLARQALGCHRHSLLYPPNSTKRILCMPYPRMLLTKAKLTSADKKASRTF